MMCLAKQGIFAHLFQKIWILVIILVMAFLVFFAFSSPVSAQSYIEDFEDFNLGTILGQDGWDCDPGGNCAQIVTTTVYSGTKSLYTCYQVGCPGFPIKARKTGLEARATGRLVFWVYPIGIGVKEIDFCLNTTASLDCNNNSAHFRLWAGFLKVRTGAGSYTNLASIDSNEWNEIQIEWNVSTQKVRGKVDVSEWSAWIEEYGTDWGNITNFGLRAGGGDARGYFDDFQYGEEWAIMPEIDPYYPPEATTTEIAIGDFNASGDYWYDPLDIEWLEFNIIFTSETDQYFFTADITASSSDSYIIPVQIYEPGTYVVSYRFWGNAWESCLYVPCYPQIVVFESDVTSTVVIGASGLPSWIKLPTIDFYDEVEPATGTIQHYIWSIKNFFKSLILPTEEAQRSFLDRVNTIKTKFPYNYLSAIKDFMVSTGGDVEQDPAIEFTLLDATGTISMDFSSADITMGSETKTFFEWIKLIASLLLFAGFLIYTVTFIRRIL